MSHELSVHIFCHGQRLFATPIFKSGDTNGRKLREHFFKCSITITIEKLKRWDNATCCGFGLFGGSGFDPALADHNVKPFEPISHSKTNKT